MANLKFNSVIVMYIWGKTPYIQGLVLSLGSGIHERSWNISSIGKLGAQ